MIYHEDQAITVHVIPCHTGTQLDSFLSDFDRTPDRENVLNELEPAALVAILPRTFEYFAEWQVS